MHEYDQNLGRTLVIISIASAVSLVNAQGTESTNVQVTDSTNAQVTNSTSSADSTHATAPADTALGQAARGPDRTQCRPDSEGEPHGRKGETIRGRRAGMAASVDAVNDTLAEKLPPCEASPWHFIAAKRVASSVGVTVAVWRQNPSGDCRRQPVQVDCPLLPRSDREPSIE